MSTTHKRYVSVADTAKLVRGALKQKFPGVKFSVRSKSYSMGASIDVSWLDGPTSKQVEAVTGLYTGASFDGMIDLKSYNDSILVDEKGNPEVVHFGADYIFQSRNYSPEFRRQIEAKIERDYGLAEGTFDGNDQLPGDNSGFYRYQSDAWHREAHETEGPRHAKAAR